MSDPVDPTISTEADKLTFEMCNVCRGGSNIQRGSAFQSQFQSGYFTDPDFDPTEYTPVTLTEKQQELLRRVWSKYSKGSDMLRHAAMTFSKYDLNFSMMHDLDAACKELQCLQNSVSARQRIAANCSEYRFKHLIELVCALYKG
jgi:hypothetical protein